MGATISRTRVPSATTGEAPASGENVRRFRRRDRSASLPPEFGSPGRPGHAASTRESAPQLEERVRPNGIDRVPGSVLTDFRTVVIQNDIGRDTARMDLVLNHVLAKGYKHRRNPDADEMTRLEQCVFFLMRAEATDEQIVATVNRAFEHGIPEMPRVRVAYEYERGEIPRTRDREAWMTYAANSPIEGPTAEYRRLITGAIIDSMTELPHPPELLNLAQIMEVKRVIDFFLTNPELNARPVFAAEAMIKFYRGKNYPSIPELNDAANYWSHLWESL